MRVVDKIYKLMMDNPQGISHQELIDRTGVNKRNVRRDVDRMAKAYGLEVHYTTQTNDSAVFCTYRIHGERNPGVVMCADKELKSSITMDSLEDGLSVKSSPSIIAVAECLFDSKNKYSSSSDIASKAELSRSAVISAIKKMTDCGWNIHAIGSTSERRYKLISYKAHQKPKPEKNKVKNLWAIALGQTW